MRREVGTVSTIRWSLGLGVAALVSVWMAEPASGIPAFARKYGTSCHTCHIAYPKLNAFGSAFRLRGYRMPGETENMIKEEPVALGSEANRRLWPKALWPSSIPGSVPLSLDVRLATVTEHDAEAGETMSNDFRFPEAIELLSGGTFGNTVSFLAAVEFELEDEHGETALETGVGHAEIHFNGPGQTGSRLNVKVGRFTPEATQSMSHGYLLTDTVPAVMFGFNPIGFHGSSEVGAGGHHGGGGGGISLPAGLDGIEVYGILGHRTDYSVGVANGMGPGDGFRDGNDSKDFFARIGHKFGGLSLDGEGEDYQAGAKNWREKSVRVGVFAYEGDGEGLLFQGTGHHASEFLEDRDFSRVGVDVNAFIQDVNLIFGYVEGEDSLAEYTSLVDEHGEEDEHGDEHADEGGLIFEEVDDFEYDAWFGEVDVVFFPWLHAGVRYEFLDPSNTNREDFERFTMNLTALIRANVKAFVEYQEDTGGDLDGNYQIKGVVRFAF